MLTFKSQFPLDSTKTVADFLECGRRWIAGSPHSELAPQIRLMTFHDGTSASSLNESIICATHYAQDKDIAGIRYEKREDGEIGWLTDVVAARTTEGFFVSVQLSVDSELPVERLDHGKRPYVIKNLMQNLGGGTDGALLVSDSPLRLREDQISLAADIICGKAGCVMPVVYASSGNDDKPFIDAEQTSKWLSGMAHVLVEPSRAFSFKLMREVYNENAYGGAVAIYWPDGVGKWLFLPTGRYEDPKEMQIAIARKVRASLLLQRTRRDCTWSHLQELIAKKRLQELKDSGSKNIDEYIHHFDSEIASKDEEIRRLEADLARTRYKRQPNNLEIEDSESGLHFSSTEKDLYQAERLEAVIDALKSAMDSAAPHSRRKDILRDLIESNTLDGERDRILEQLKGALRQYSSMTAPIRSILQGLGFEIIEDGKHFKLIFRDDSRYPFILPKSGSDFRGGMNAFSELKKRIF